jgi:hypothetical protein
VAVLRRIHCRHRLTLVNKAVVTQPEKRHLFAATRSGKAENIMQRAALLTRTAPDILMASTPSGSSMEICESLLMKAAPPLNRAAKPKLRHCGPRSGSMFTSSIRDRTWPQHRA